ncbi:galactoside alpha-(1,2)-fucosyltransferase 2-like [Leptodactylus fuscus]|uniref:galactoside alpha-(1,2)-fucosyltransferase 2-like n=1 Tax=Leptodactylus fuscus TaxID=238119 RepID=UPI003F4E6B3E
MWTIEPIGRLGNLMGEYATLYALAKLNGHRAFILPEMYWPLSRVFKITLPVIAQKDFMETNWINLELHDWMSPEYRNLDYEYLKLIGYPCSWTFYEDVKDEILQEFTFHDYIKEGANKYLSSLQEGRGNVTFVGVHVRRGDYLTIMPNVWKGVVADKMYLQTAMDYFRKKYKNVLFIVTSNGMDWCKENIDTTLGDVHFSGDGEESSPARDFALLVHCNHTIMTVGTFGYWAGYLARGETIYLSNFTLPDSDFLKIFKYEAAYLPNWLGIPADLSPLLSQMDEGLFHQCTLLEDRITGSNKVGKKDVLKGLVIGQWLVHQVLDYSALEKWKRFKESRKVFVSFSFLEDEMEQYV